MVAQSLTGRGKHTELKLGNSSMDDMYRKSTTLARTAYMSCVILEETVRLCVVKDTNEGMRGRKGTCCHTFLLTSKLVRSTHAADTYASEHALQLFC